MQEHDARSLTTRDRAILALIADGQTAKHIARAMNLSPRAVERQMENCRRKLGVTNNAHLVAAAIRGGLLADAKR